MTDAPGSGGPYACPSHSADASAKLLGVVNENGMVDILPRPIPVNAEFLSGQDLERRFRFTGACVAERCSQWKSGGCNIGRLVAQLEPLRSEVLKPCAIRGTCRWFAQDGAASCHGCKYVITDNRARPEDEVTGGDQLAPA